MSFREGAVGESLTIHCVKQSWSFGEKHLCVNSNGSARYSVLADYAFERSTFRLAITVVPRIIIFVRDI